MSAHVLMYRCNLGSFVDFSFRELHPGKIMLDNWHIRLIANMLQLMWVETHPDMVRRVIFNLPPGHLKTHICSVAFPAWVLGRDPRKSVLILSETHDQALEIRERISELMRTPRYRRVFPRARISREGRELELTYGGRIRHAGVGHSLPHRRSDLVVIDNPQSLHNLDRLDPSSFVEISRTLKDPKRGIILVATRRLAKNDLSAYLHSLGNWGRLELPIVAMQEAYFELLADDDHHRLKGEPLCSVHEDWDMIEAHIREIGGDAFSWQYMQGQYSPVTTGSRPYFVDGKLAGRMVGTFDPTYVTLEDFAKLREEYETRYRAILEEIRKHPLKPS